MSRQRDIERVLDAWLRPGPTIMPDRLFDEVLERIERQPQRRLARAQLRISAMRPIPLLAAAAAIVVAVGAGIVLLGRPATPDIGAATPVPSVAPVASASAPSATPATPSSSPVSALPSELQYRWIGAPRLIAGIASVEVLPLLWISDRVRLNWDLARLYLDSEAVADGPGAITLTFADASVGGCAIGDVGHYTWSVTPDGMTLALRATQDACAPRAAAFSGTWTRAACRNSDDTCLGEVPAGTWTSTFLDLRNDVAQLKPRGAYGQLRYTVPNGWANAGDWPDSYDLVPAAEYARSGGDPGGASRHGIYTAARPAAWDAPPDCSVKIGAGVGRSPADLAARIAGRPGVVTSTPESITIGSHSGKVLDIHLQDGWTRTCPGEKTPSAPILANASGSAASWTWAVAAGERMRLILLDIGGGNTVAIAVDDTASPSRFDALLTQAMPIIESFEFPQ